MNKTLTRFAAALAVLLFACAAYTVQAGAPAAKQNSGKSADKPQAKPQSQPQTKPQSVQSTPATSNPVIGTLQSPNPKQSPMIGSLSKGSSIGSLSKGSLIGSMSSGSSIGSMSRGSSIGSLSRGSSIGSLNSGSTIGTLQPSKQNQTPFIGNTGPISPAGSGIGSLNPDLNVDKIQKQAAEAAKEIEPMIPQIRQQAAQAAREIEPMIPQIQQQAAQAAKQIQGQGGAAAAPQIVQDAPQSQNPIVIMPRSVRAGNTGNGRRSGGHALGAGYSGGNGQGPLIYNP